jgi:NAD(P)H-hydrate epimerase
MAQEQLRGEAAEHAALAQHIGVKIHYLNSSGDLEELGRWLARAVIVVDALFGTGMARPLDGLFAEAVRMMNRATAPLLAADIASGIDSDSGHMLGEAVRADWTLPIAAYKWGHWLNAGHDFAGKVLAPASIGMADETIRRSQHEKPDSLRSAYLMEKKDIALAFPSRPRLAHKKDYGHVWIFGGSVGYTGAPRLAGMGAFAAGAGLVSLACPEDVYPVIAASSLEVMVHPQVGAPWDAADAVLAGPGWGTQQQKALKGLMKTEAPLVLDADALNMLAEDTKLAGVAKRRNGLNVLTPHPGEAGRLLGKTAKEIQSSRVGSALKLAEKYHAWVVLKGADSLVASPEGDVWLCPFGSPRLAVAGTGDVLAGMITAMLGRGVAPETALPAAVALHALAGEQDGWHLAGELTGQVIRILSGK